jgi:hypothetical protein
MDYELIYTSISVPYEIAESELEYILIGARRKNLELGITGLLLFHSGEFIQLLEGSREAVEEVYNRHILPDRRHRKVEVCWQAPIEQRSFAQWSMGYVPLKDVDRAGYPGIEGYLAGGVAALDLSGPESFGRKFLLSFYARMQASPLRPTPWGRE